MNPTKFYVDLCYMYIFLGRVQENLETVKLLEG